MKKTSNQLFHLKLIYFFLAISISPSIYSNTSVPSGNVSGTWTKNNSPYILSGAITIPAGSTLTIEAGVKVLFPRYDYKLTVNGILNAQGTAADSIFFIGSAALLYSSSSTHGGAIYFNKDSSVLKYISVDSMGDKSTSSGAFIIADKIVPTISNCVIRHSETTDIYTWIGGAKNITSLQGIIGVNGTNSVSTDAIMPKTGSGSYYNLLGSVTINVGSKLTIKPGAILYFPRYDYKLTINGILDAQGIVSDSIRFIGRSNKTYSSSSTHGGSVILNKDSSILRYISIDSLGDASYNNGAIAIADKVTPTITNSTIRNSETIDIYTWLGGAKNISVFKGIIGIMAGTSTIDAIMSNTGAGSYYNLLGSVTTNNGTRLTINSGSVIYFPRYDYKLTINGIMNAQGTATDSVYIKGKNAKAYSSASTHGGSIVFNKDSSTLNYVSIDSMGDASYNNGAIVIADKITPSITNSTIRNSESTDIYTWIGGAKNISNYKGIIGVMTSTITSDATMSKTGTNSYYKLLGSTTLNNGFKLTIKPGVKVYFPRYDYKLTINGIMDAQGTTTDSIRFIGQSNKTYSSSSNYGGAIYFNKDSSTLSYVSIDSLGDSYYNSGALVIADKITPTITNSTIRNSESTDIYTWIGGAKKISFFKGIIGVMASTATVDATMSKTGTNSYYKLLGSVIINNGVKLTIKSGVKMYFPRYDYKLTINGIMDAQGIASDSIRFIGQSNKAYSSSSNYGGAIYFNKDSSILKYISIDSLGDASTCTGAVIIADKITPTITNSTIRNSETTDIYTWIGGAKNISNYKGIIGVMSSTVSIGATMPNAGTGSYYNLLGSVTVNNGVKLTIKPGVTLYFPRYDYKLIMNGVLDAQGMITDSIYIKGKSAKAYSSSSNYGGAVYFNKDSSILKYVSIDSLGDASYHNGAIVIADKVIPSITNSTIQHSETTDIYTWLGGAKNISNYKGTVGIMAGTATSNALMPKTGTDSYYKLLGSITVNAGLSLTISPGAKIVFPSGNTDLTIKGVLNARGNRNDSIRFIGTYLGNTTPYGGSLYLSSDSCSLYYVAIDSLGAYDDGALIISGSSSVKYISVRNSKNVGIYMSSSKTDLSYSDIYRNVTGISVYKAKPLLNNLNIYNNTTYGINNSYKTYQVDATNCYWGTSTGPYNATSNPGGTGNAVSDSVKVSPWASSAILPSLPYLSSFSPAATLTDSFVTISGLRFTGATSVTFGGVASKSFSVVNDSLIKAKVGAGATGAVKVITTKGEDSISGFLYCPGLVLHADFTYQTSFSDLYLVNTTANGTGYSWNFGDNLGSVEVNPVHHYTNAGVYTVCLAANNACSVTTDTSCKFITISGVFTDVDRDGLFDLTETAKYGTRTDSFDTNGDGLGDGPNVFTGLLPLGVDTDGDGITNLQELLNGTNPLLSDTDFDGVPDNLDPFPLNRYLSKLPPKNSSDHLPPVVTLYAPF